MIALMQQIQRVSKEDSVVHGLALGVSEKLCGQIGHDRTVIGHIDTSYMRLHEVSMQQSQILSNSAMY